MGLLFVLETYDAISLVEEFVVRLEDISDGCAERFPFEAIDELKQEYLSV